MRLFHISDKEVHRSSYVYTVNTAVPKGQMWHKNRMNY